MSAEPMSQEDFLAQNKFTHSSAEESADHQERVQAMSTLKAVNLFNFV
jgi:hypothetical protein